MRKRKAEGGGISNLQRKHASIVSETRNQDDTQGPGDSATQTEAPGLCLPSWGVHLLQVYPADVGQSRFAGAARFYQVLRIHHHCPHATHEVGFLMLHREGHQGTHAFGQISLPGPIAKTTGPSKLGLREKEKPGHSIEFYTFSFLLKSLSYLLRLN